MFLPLSDIISVKSVSSGLKDFSPLREYFFHENFSI